MKTTLALLINSLISFHLFGQDITDNILIHYEFNNNILDASINAYHGENYGASFVPDRFGNENSAIYFDGIDDYINFPNLNELKPDLPVSFSFFIKYDTLSYEDSTVFNTSFEEDVNTGIYMNIQSSTGQYQVSFGDGSNFYTSNSRRTYTSNSIIDNTQWHHIVLLVNSNSEMKIYVDCEELAGTYSGFGGNLQYSDLPGVIGKHDRSLSSPADYFKGTIDDFIYWERELLYEEILELCNTLGTEANLFVSEAITIYPNPSNGTFSIKTKFNFNRLEVYNSLGKLVKAQGNSTTLDLNNCRKGIYFVKIIRETSITTKKIVLQ